jgi:DNA end-binding protein Ku
MDEIEGISTGEQPKVEDKELSLGKTLVDNLTSEQFDIGKYSDTYSKELEKLIEAKSKGQKLTISEEEGEKTEDTTNLLEALKASISMKTKPRKQKRN